MFNKKSKIERDLNAENIALRVEARALRAEIRALKDSNNYLMGELESMRKFMKIIYDVDYSTIYDIDFPNNGVIVGDTTK